MYIFYRYAGSHADEREFSLGEESDEDNEDVDTEKGILSLIPYMLHAHKLYIVFKM